MTNTLHLLNDSQANILMIIGFTGIELPQGKIKFHDQRLIDLVNKDNPKKVSPYFFEFVLDNFIQSFAIIVPKDKILDILILDILL